MEFVPAWCHGAIAAIAERQLVQHTQADRCGNAHVDADARSYCRVLITAAAAPTAHGSRRAGPARTVMTGAAISSCRLVIVAWEGEIAIRCICIGHGGLILSCDQSRGRRRERSLQRNVILVSTAACMHMSV